jgi:hypothetical protein
MKLSIVTLQVLAFSAIQNVAIGLSISQIGQEVLEASTSSMAIDQTTGWTNCSSPDAIFQLENLMVEPESPKAGDKVKIRLSGKLKEDIVRHGEVRIRVKFGVLTVVDQISDFCEALTQIPDVAKCPLKAGDYSIVKEQTLPSSLPPGKYTINITAKNESGKQIVCVQGVFTLKN